MRTLLVFAAARSLEREPFAVLRWRAFRPRRLTGSRRRDRRRRRFACASRRPKGRSSSRCTATGRRTAPIGFYELVTARYFDDNRFFRVVKGQWAQFGINGDPAVATRWRTRTIPDDPREAVERPRHGGVRVRRAERADDAGVHRAEGSVRSAGRAGVRAVRPRRRGHGRRRRAEQRVRRDVRAAASAPASSSRCSTAATRISIASSRGSIDSFVRW